VDLKNTFSMNLPSGQNKSLIFNYVQEDYEKWVQNFAHHLKITGHDERLLYPAEIGSGYTKAKILESGFSYRIANYILNSNIEYQRTPSDKFQLILYFYQLEFEQGVYCKIDDTVIESSDKTYNIALMTTSHTNEKVVFKNGTAVKGLSVQLNEDWLMANIKDFDTHKNEMARKKSCIIDFISAKQRKILNDIFNRSENTAMPELFIKSRVLRLTEQFLSALCRKGLTEVPEFTNQKDFQALLKVETVLLQNFAGQFPSIESLAKTALMSESKLKKLFKKAFGLAPYEYYQKNRMHKAKEMLCSRNRSVTQVGIMLGYQNMSNFSTAFKKEFNFLPSQAHEMA
jgi:AraC-like DNA-binding protein